MTRSPRPLMIGNRRIGPGEPTYVVAELSANHHHDFALAEQLVRAAKNAGADAVKLQTYTPDTMTIRCDGEYFRIGKGTIWEGRNLYDLYGEAYTPWSWHPKLQSVAHELGMDLFSTPFDATAVDFLQDLGVPAHKIASFEIVDLPLLRRVAATGKPILMSTGMATLGEIGDAVRAVRAAGCRELALLKCNSAYPAPPEEMNLATIPHMAASFGVPVGLSDHTLEVTVPAVAVALGACIIEKHFTLSRATPGPDSSFSLEPHEFSGMVKAIRMAEKVVGKVCYDRTASETASHVFRRSLFVVEDMDAGEVFTERNVRSIRPGYGLPPKYLPNILGRRAACKLQRGTPLEWSACQ